MNAPGIWNWPEHTTHPARQQQHYFFFSHPGKVVITLRVMELGLIRKRNQPTRIDAQNHHAERDDYFDVG